MPQKVYLVAVAMYILLFLMFCRFFLWKRYSESRYWKVRPTISQKSILALAHSSDQEIPFFSILIPARNEAEVIEKTVKHLLALNYPTDAYEVIVVTDEKEALESARLRLGVVQEALAFLRGEVLAAKRAEARVLALGVLSELALREYRNRDLHDHAWLAPLELTQGADWRCRDIITTLARDLLVARGRLNMGRVYCLLRRAFPECNDTEIARLYPNYLSLTLPVVATYAELCGERDHSLLRSIIRCTTKANHRVTQDLLASFTRLVTAGIMTNLLTLLAEDEALELCKTLYTACFPTTQDVLTRVQQETGLGTIPVLKHVIVPFDYDGLCPGSLTGTAVPSTKGRALNFALAREISPKTSICGFYDAESRPASDVLLYVAHKRLTDCHTMIWQGPVFQVRNFYEMGPFSKIASLYQAVAHDWYLPVVFRRLPFVGGTNLYVDYNLLVKLKGYDHQSLTEDLELGTRAYLTTGAWPDYLPYASSEQTPPQFKAFYRQRLRWGTGHLQVLDKVRLTEGCPPERKALLLRQLSIKGPLEWTFYQAVTLLPPTMLFLYWTGNVDPSVLPGFIRALLNILSLVYISFTFYAFYRYYRHVDCTSRPLTWYGNVGVGMELCFLPLAAFFFPVPYTSAMVLKAVGRHPTAWTKTPRTRE